MTFVKEQFHIMDFTGDQAKRIQGVFHTKEEAEEFLEANLGPDYTKDRHWYEIHSNKPKFVPNKNWKKYT